MDQRKIERVGERDFYYPSHSKMHKSHGKKKRFNSFFCLFTQSGYTHTLHFFPPYQTTITLNWMPPSCNTNEMTMHSTMRQWIMNMHLQGMSD